MFNKTKLYFRGVYTELKKVVWPTRTMTINHTAIVIISIVVATMIFGLIDLGFSKILEIVIER